MTSAELTAVNNRAAAFSRDLPWRATAAALDLHALLNDSKPRRFTGKNPGMWSVKWKTRLSLHTPAKPPKPKRWDIKKWSTDVFFDSQKKLSRAEFASVFFRPDDLKPGDKDLITLGCPEDWGEHERAPGTYEYKDSNNPTDWRFRLVARYKTYQRLAAAGKRAGIARWKEFKKGPRSFPFDRFPNQGGRAKADTEIFETLVPYWNYLFHWCRKFRKWQWEHGHRWDSRYIAKPGKWMYEDLRTEGEQVQATIPHHRGATIMGEKKGKGGDPPKLTHFEWAVIWDEVAKQCRILSHANEGCIGRDVMELRKGLDWAYKCFELAAMKGAARWSAIIDLRKRGKSFKEIADKLGCSKRTIERDYGLIVENAKRITEDHYGTTKNKRRIA